MVGTPAWDMAGHSIPLVDKADPVVGNTKAGWDVLSEKKKKHAPPLTNIIGQGER